MRVFLDDERNPEDVTWITLYEGPYVVLRSQAEFQAHLLQHGIPDVLSLDNDLGEGGEVTDCVRWMVNRVLDGELSFPDGFAFTVHSKNNIAAEWIQQYLVQALEHVC